MAFETLSVETPRIMWLWGIIENSTAGKFSLCSGCMDDSVKKLSAGKCVYFVTVVVRSIEAVGEGDDLTKCDFFSEMVLKVRHISPVSLKCEFFLIPLATGDIYQYQLCQSPDFLL